MCLVKVSKKTKEIDPEKKGLTPTTVRTKYYELLSEKSFTDLNESQYYFDQWRDTYNYERPHEALGMETPSHRYHPSLRTYPEQLGSIEYLSDDVVRKVDTGGRIQFQGRRVKVGKAFRKQIVVVRATQTDGIYNIFFCQQKIKQIKLCNLTKSEVE